MFALPGLLALIFVDLMRPQEYATALRGLPLHHLAAGLATLGFVVDLRMGLTRLRAAPHLVLTILFILWCLVTVGIRFPGQIMARASALLIPFAIYLLVAHAVQTFRVFEILCAALLALTLALSAVGVHQGLAPTACFRARFVDSELRFIYDGRPCTLRIDCEADSPEPGAFYYCEKVGLFGTSSILGRVRFRGTLEDPNELALVLAMALPFAFAFFERRRSLVRLVMLAATVVMVGLCGYFTKSRGGQLVYISVLAVYFVKRVGVGRGLALGSLLAVPILLFGGRSDASAAESTMQRINCWWVGMHLFVSSPVVGVGFGQFLEHHRMTAHNSYILAAAELGFPGLLLWSAIMYLSLKIPIQALRAHVLPVGRTWALALLAALAGLLVGVMFLSFNYKNVLWMYVGLTAVLHGAIRRHDPTFDVKLGLRDLALVVFGCLALMVAFIGYTGWKMGW